MEKHQIFFFGLPVVFGLAFFIYSYEFEPKNIFKEYLLIFIYTIIGLIVFIIIDVIFLGHQVKDILLGNILLMHRTPIIACYSFIVFILLSAISDILYPLISPLVEKIKANKQKAKFRTPKIK